MHSKVYKQCHKYKIQYAMSYTPPNPPMDRVKPIYYAHGSLQENVLLVTKKFVTKNPAFRH